MPANGDHPAWRRLQELLSGRAKYPKFRKKGIHDRFAITNDQFCIKGSFLRIPKLGWVSMHEPLRFKGKILSASISRTADRWFVSITVDAEDSPKRRAENQGTVGVDLGVSALATLSTGQKIAGPKAHKALLGRVRRLSRSLSRKHLAAKASLGLTPKSADPQRRQTARVGEREEGENEAGEASRQGC